MPLYEYQCESCLKKTEVIQSFSEPPLSVCESCGGPLKRLLSPPAVQFKGSGWYVSDYGRKGGESKSAEATKPEKESKEKGTETKAEGKSETPAPAAKSGGAAASSSE